MKLFGQSDDDVANTPFAAESALYAVEAESGDRARTDEDDDAVR